MTGTVHSVASAPSDGADHPAWARALRLLALVPTVASAVVILAFVRAVGVWLRPRAGRGGPSPLTYGLAGIGIAGLAGRRRRQTQIWRLDTAGGRRTVRIAVAPHEADVRTGDNLVCWGRQHRDGAFRAYRAVNATSGQPIEPDHASWLVLTGGVLWALVLLLVVLVLHSQM